MRRGRGESIVIRRGNQDDPARPSSGTLFRRTYILEISFRNWEKAITLGAMRELT